MRKTMNIKSTCQKIDLAKCKKMVLHQINSKTGKDSDTDIEDFLEIILTVVKNNCRPGDKKITYLNELLRQLEAERKRGDKC